MKSSTDWLTITTATGISALLIWSIAGPFDSEGAGSLTPPPGAPAPTMPSLDEIADTVSVLTSSGKNFALRNTTNVQVWNSRTGAWTSAQSVAGLSNVIESDGNFCALGSSGGTAWNRETGTWTAVSNITSAASVTKSNGNFCIVGSNNAAAWNSETGSWTTRTVSSPMRVEVSNGNFCVIGASQAAAWNHKTGVWSVQSLSPNFVNVISSEVFRP